MSAPPQGAPPGLDQLLALFDDGPRYRIEKDAFGKLDPNRRRFAALTQRIGRVEPHFDRQPGPGMRRQIVIARRARLLPVKPRQRQVEHDLLAGLAVRARDHRLYLLDPIIVGRPIADPQRRLRRWRRRLGEGDRRRMIGNDGDRPAAELGTRLFDFEKAASHQFQRKLEIFAVDRGKEAEK
jgi:hypothetical protein